MNLVLWAMIGILLIMIMAIVSNSGQTATANIQHQFDRIGCPMPEGSGLWNSSGTLQHSNFTYNYPNVNNQTLTLTCTEVHTMDGLDYCFGCPTPPAVGVLVFINDYLSELFGNKASAFFTIIAYVLTPINLNIWGFTIGDLSGVSLMLVIGLYIFAYIPIGIMIYKAISPFTGL